MAQRASGGARLLFLAAALSCFAAGGGVRSLSAMSLTEAVSIAVDSNPEIGQAIANREAIEFELRQGRGRYLPRVDIEGRVGAEIIDSPTTRANDDESHMFVPRESSVVMRQLLFDGFRTRSEVERQASRVDGASFRVHERSQFIALSVIRQYLDILRLRQSLSYAQQNFIYHRDLLDKIKQGASGGSISIADRQQAQERLFATKAQIAELRSDLSSAEATFIKLVGQAVGTVKRPPSPARQLPRNVDAALGHARKNHPTIKIAVADIDAAAAQVKKAEADFYPQLSLEARGTAGRDLGGLRGNNYEAQVGVVMSWNLYNGGTDKARIQEQIRRLDEERLKLNQISREVDEAVRISWYRRIEEANRLHELRQQLEVQNQVVASYAEQFSIGQRSLLDLLDAQNSKFGAQLSVETSWASTLFAEYRIFAAMGTLLQQLKIEKPPAADAYAREQAKVPPPPPAEQMPRYSPDRSGTLGPIY